jgi:predicted dehydrogenase
MSTSKKVRIGAIGVGGRLRGVLSGLLNQGNQQIELAAINDPFEGSIENALKQFKLDRSSVRTQEEILADESIDWVFIGSPNRYHPEQVIAALKAGKNVFCEKPLGVDLSRVPELIKVWKESGKQFAFGLVLRYAPMYQQVKKLLEAGRIGKIISLEFNETLSPGHGGYIHGNWRRKRENAGTHLLEKCCHDMDLCLWMVGSNPMRVASFGGCDFFIPENAHLAKELVNPDSGKTIFEIWDDPHRVDPFGTDKDIVDNQVAIIEFANRVRATFHTNCSSAITERRFYIVGTHGAIRADVITGVIEVSSIVPGVEHEVIDTRHGGGHGGGDGYMSQQLARTLLEGAAPAASMYEGVRSLIMACGIDKALDTGTVYDLTKDWDLLQF